MAMFSYHFFEKLAQAFFCDGVISGGASLPYYYQNKQNLTQGEYFNYVL